MSLWLLRVFFWVVDKSFLVFVLVTFVVVYPLYRSAQGWLWVVSWCDRWLDRVDAALRGDRRDDL